MPFCESTDFRSFDVCLDSKSVLHLQCAAYFWVRNVIVFSPRVVTLSGLGLSRLQVCIAAT